MANHLWAGLAALATVAASGGASAGVNLVFNGGFETGNFSGWTVPPPAPPPQGSNFQVDGDGGHTGQHYAQLSSWNLAFMSQFLPDTVAGADYELEFWARLPGSFPPGIGYSISIRWEGQFVAAEFVGGPDGANWTHYSVPLTASFAGSFLEFGQASFPGEIHIDSISVRQVPVPSAVPLMALGGVVAFRRTRR